MKTMILVGLATILLLSGFTPIGGNNIGKKIRAEAVKTVEAQEACFLTIPRVMGYVGDALDK